MLNQFSCLRLKIDTANKHFDDSWKSFSKDDVYIGKYHQWPIYTVAEAIKFHRETHDPTMYNVPSAPIVAHIEVNMKGEKATRFVDTFHRMASVQHKFNHGEERSILAFVKGQENVEIARKAGATMVGGSELVKQIQNGDMVLADYQYIVAHPSVLPEMVPIRGLMKKKFPNPKNGTLGADMKEMIERFMNGIQYSGKRDDNQQDFGLVTTAFGTLDMDPKHLEENLVALLKDIDMIRPKRAGKFITRVLLKSPPSPEAIKIDPFNYIPEGQKEVKSTKVDKKAAPEEDDDEPAEAKEAVN